MTVTFALTETDLKQGARLYVRTRFLLRRLLPLLIAFALFSSYDTVQTMEPVAVLGLVSSIIVVVLLMILLKRVGLPFLAGLNARNLAKSRLITAEQTLTLTEEGFDLRLADGHQRYLWSDFNGFVEDERVMLLLQIGNAYRPIPKRAFSKGELDDFRSAARANIKVPQGFRLGLPKGLSDFSGPRKQ